MKMLGIVTSNLLLLLLTVSLSVSVSHQKGLDHHQARPKEEILAADAQVDASLGFNAGGVQRHILEEGRLLQQEQNLETDMQALLSFRQRIEKDPLDVLVGWNPLLHVNCCDWYGVRCTKARVVALDLTGCGLVSPLPTATLAPLDQLQDVHLAGNRFYGYGSEQIVASACSTLSALDLSSNNLKGTFSTLSLQSCKTLTYLNLSNNYYSGNLPSHILGRGSTIQLVDLSFNNFSGTVSTDMFTSCGNLTYLDLSHNGLTGRIPKGISHCQSLQHLDLSYNSFNDTVPDIFPSAAIPSPLKYLSIAANHFSGTLANQLFVDEISCPNLLWLDLSGNLFTGEIPHSLASCTSLLLLNLSYNAFIGSLPLSLVELKSLQKLYLQDNKFTGPIPPDYGNSLTSLQDLDLSINQLTGKIPSALSNCSSLSYLNLADNFLFGSFPTKIVCSIPSLQTLIISFNNLTGTLPSSLNDCKYLTTLDLSANRLYGNIPDTLCAPMLKELFLSDNDLVGFIAQGLSNCTSLVMVDFSCNHLGGNLPPSLFNLPNLQEVMAWGNLLEGEIPPNVCAAEGLTKLVLNVNLFTGTIPISISNCSNLEWFSLSSNALTGSLPVQLGSVPKLGILQLANNTLSGGIPAELGNCTNLIWLDLNSNMLDGIIPPELAKQAGKTTRGNLAGTQFAFLKHLGSSCQGLGGLIEFHGIREQRLMQLPNFQQCNLTRLYLGDDPYFFTTTGSLQFLDLSFNQLGGTISPEMGTLSYLQVFSLSYNQLTGTIPSSLSNLVRMTILYLDHNQLQGSIPPSLAELGLLNELDLSSNNLSGSIPASGTLSTFPAAAFANNPGLCGAPLLPCEAPAPTSLSSEGAPRPSSSEWSSIAIIIAALGTFVFIMASVCGLLACALTYQQHMKKSVRDQFIETFPSKENVSWNISAANEPLSINVATFERPLRKLTFANLLEATGGFNSDAIVGHGGFGDVYKAKLDDGTTIAVKKLIHLVGQGDREFMAEMETIGKIKHRNLVPLLGYCKVGEERLLVYEFMEGGSLDKRLHGNCMEIERKECITDNEHVRLSWEMRKRIALGTARGLCFLHHSCIPHIIHRDLKSSNVLLDDTLEARISDFGMARLVSASETHLSVTSVVGTPGYVPPEYCHSFRCTTKGDVYSYGVVLLELVTGRRPTWSSCASVALKKRWTSLNERKDNTEEQPSVITQDTDQIKEEKTRPAEVEHDLVGWVKKHVKEGRHREVLDPVALTGNTTGAANLSAATSLAPCLLYEKEMLHYLDTACWCVEERPWKRPNMLQVMALLRELHDGQDDI